MGRLPTFLLSTSSFQSPYYSSSIPGKTSGQVGYHPTLWVVSIPERQESWTPITFVTTCSKGMSCVTKVEKTRGYCPTQSTMHKGGLPLWKKWVTVSAPSFGVGPEKVMPGRNANSLLATKEVNLCVKKPLENWALKCSLTREIFRSSYLYDSNKINHWSMRS